MTREEIYSIKNSSLEIKIFKCYSGFQREPYEVEVKSFGTGCSNITKRWNLSDAHVYVTELLEVF